MLLCFWWEILHVLMCKTLVLAAAYTVFASKSEYKYSIHLTLQGFAHKTVEQRTMKISKSFFETSRNIQIKIFEPKN